MQKIHLVNKFTKSIIKYKRRNEVNPTHVTSTLITAALSSSFVNEACKSSGQISKSQVIYRKLNGKTLKEIERYFRDITVEFLKKLKLYNKNHEFLLSIDTTYEAFYGDPSKAEDKIYLHHGSIAKGSEHYYKYITISITCDTSRYILDGIMIPVGCYIEDYVYEMVKFVKEYLPIKAILLDRGFSSWGVIYKLKKPGIPYIIFWEKIGNWYKEYMKNLKDGESFHMKRVGIYNRDKTNYRISSNFVLIKQLEYDGKTFDWIFATNLKKEKAELYVKLYKKRWGIETIYRITDDIRIYTTSTNCIIRYFLFIFTCLVYNIWRFFQMYLGEEFTMANCKIALIVFMIKYGMINPQCYDELETLIKTFFDI